MFDTYKNKFRITCFLIVLMGNISSAQQKISLEAAFEKARSQNLTLRSEALMIKYHQMLVKSSFVMERTGIQSELGQFNSSFFDTGFGISQSILWPTAYHRRKKMYEAQLRTSEYYGKLSEAEIKRQLDDIYIEYSFLLAKKSLLVYQDSLYTQFLEKVTFRWQQGESNILEKVTAEQQKMNLSSQLAMLNKMLEWNVLKFSLIINEEEGFIPLTEPFHLLPYNIIVDSTRVLNHPSLQLAHQEIELAKKTTMVEKSALLPVVNAGYRNMSIRGTGADNLVYTGGDRFSSFQVGISVPVFQKSIRASIKASEILHDVKTFSYEASKADVFNQIEQKYLLYNESMLLISNYQNQAVPNAKLIRSVSEKQFASGQINYLEYVMLTNQAITIETEYLSLLKEANMLILDLHYLTNQY